MTKKEALTIAMSAVTNEEVKATIQNMINQLSQPHRVSEDTKQRQNAKRRTETAAARAELTARVIPVLRAAITAEMTAKEIYTAAKDNLPEDFTANKVQNILLREMRDELVITERKGKANTYHLF